jgi:hypothetical protein
LQRVCGDKMTEFKLRDIDQKRCNHVQTLIESDPLGHEKWYIHSVLAQCFLPYRDQKNEMFWNRRNGNITLNIAVGQIEGPQGEMKTLGLPFGAKPRLFLSKIQTDAIRNQSPIIPVETSMTGMLKDLGFKVTGGKTGTIASFKDQTSRLAACRFKIIHNQNNATGTLSRNVNADIFKAFELWFPTHPDQQTLWPTEIVLTDEFYENLKEHAIPYDFRGLKHIQNNARAIDIYLWMTQRLYRIPKNKPLFLKWEHLYEMFGGGIKEPRNFPAHFKKAVLAAMSAYPEARLEEHQDGFIFKASPPPIPRTRIGFGDK